MEPKYYVLFNDGYKAGPFHYRASAEEMAGKKYYTLHAVAIIRTVPREELIQNEMEAAIQNLFAEIPGVTFSKAF